jgi:hypothetical protein
MTAHKEVNIPFPSSRQFVRNIVCECPQLDLPYHEPISYGVLSEVKEPQEFDLLVARGESDANSRRSVPARYCNIRGFNPGCAVEGPRVKAIITLPAGVFGDVLWNGKTLSLHERIQELQLPLQ